MSVMPLKYVRFADDSFMIFSSSIAHQRARERITVKPKSAGFLMFDEFELFAYGDSTTLEIKSDPTDTIFFEGVFSNE